ncbi:DUF2913 family protein, partial [Vibrio parahaemolyticus]|nr:DUF2913 family protein [Vibrio parahaemolyticus]
LLHLFISVAYSERHVTREARNQILLRWFKPRLKQNKYRLIKKEIKSIILAGKEHHSLLEERLCDLRELSQHYQTKLNDMHKLHYLLEHLREEHGIKADLSDDITQYQPNTIYISKQHLEQCFSNDKKQLKPLLFILSKVDINSFTKFVGDFGFHKLELNEEMINDMAAVRVYSIT